VKFSLPLILAVITLASALNACTTLANRRDLYSPAKPEGPYTDMLAHSMISETSAKTPPSANNHGPGSYQRSFPGPQ